MLMTARTHQEADGEGELSAAAVVLQERVTDFPAQFLLELLTNYFLGLVLVFSQTLKGALF